MMELRNPIQFLMELRNPYDGTKESALLLGR